MPRSYSTRPVAKFRDQCLNRGIRTGILNLTGHKKNRATKVCDIYFMYSNYLILLLVLLLTL